MASNQPYDVLNSTGLPQISEGCAECFTQLHTHIERLFEKSGYSGGYRRAFVTLFGHDIESFTVTMTLYLDQLQQQMDKADFSENCCTVAYGVILKQLQAFIESRFIMEYDYDSHMKSKRFADHTGLEVDAFRVTLLHITGNVKEFIKARAHIPQTSVAVAVERTRIESYAGFSTHEVDASH